MALETLKGIKQIGGFNVVVMDELREQHPEMFNESGSMDYKRFEAEIRPKNFVYIRYDVNSISFTLQNGPMKEVGVNGCLVETMICAALVILEKLGESKGSSDFKFAINHLNGALFYLDELSGNGACADLYAKALGGESDLAKLKIKKGGVE